MAARLKYVDPKRRPGAFSRAYARFSGTRLARFISAKVVWKLDPYLLRATRGRFGMGLVIPTALLETRGARSGALRRNAVIYFHDGDRVTIVASKAGHEKHPAWFHNLRAHPDVTFAGIPMRASVVEDEAERERLWTLADRLFAPYAVYRREAAKVNRTVPIVQLTPRGPTVERLPPEAAGDRALADELARIVNDATPWAKPASGWKAPCGRPPSRWPTPFAAAICSPPPLPIASSVACACERSTPRRPSWASSRPLRTSGATASDGSSSAPPRSSPASGAR